MEIVVQAIVTVVCSVLASSGLWAFLDKHSAKKDVKVDMLIGLAHDRILDLIIQFHKYPPDPDLLEGVTLF